MFIKNFRTLLIPALLLGAGLLTVASTSSIAQPNISQFRSCVTSADLNQLNCLSNCDSGTATSTGSVNRLCTRTCRVRFERRKAECTRKYLN